MVGSVSPRSRNRNPDFGQDSEEMIELSQWSQALMNNMEQLSQRIQFKPDIQVD